MPKKPTPPPTAPPTRTYRLDDLAEAVDLPVRTIRYYIQRGLLPAPEFRGAQTVYTAGHRLRLDAIRVLQEKDLPLDEIARLLDRLPADRLAAIARGEWIPPTSPVEFLRQPEALINWVDTFTPAEERRRVLRLAPGLELHVAENASPQVRRLADQLVREAGNRWPDLAPRNPRKGERS